MEPKLIEKALLPIGVATTIISGIVWITMLQARTIQNEKDLADQKTVSMKYTDTIAKIDRRLARIEGKLGIREEE